MAGQTESLLAKLGLDISEFKARAAQAGDDVKGIKKNFADLKDLIGAGGISAGAIKIFSAIIDHAKQSKDGMDENVAAVQRYGESLAGLKTSALDFGVSVVGGLNRFGEAAGAALKGAWASVTGTRKEFDAAEGSIAASEKSIKQIEANLANAKKHATEFNAINKQIADLDEKRKESSFKALTQQERMNQLANEQAELTAKLASFDGTALERRKLILDLKKAESSLESETADFAEKQRKANADRWEEERKANMAKLDNAGKLKLLNDEIAAAQAIIASGVLSAKNAEEMNLNLKQRQKELSELTGKLNEEERKKQEDFEKKSRLSQEEELELFKLVEKQQRGLTVAEHNRLEVLQAQRREKYNQTQIDILLEKGISNLTAEEWKLLDQLNKQDKKLEDALAKKKAIAAVVVTEQLPAEQAVTAEMEKQAKEQKRQADAAAQLQVAKRTGSSDNTRLTDRQIDEKIANLTRYLQDAAANDPTGKYGYLTAPERYDLEEAQREKRERALFRNEVQRLGAEEALGKRSAFEEARYRNYIRPEDEARSVRQAAAIDRLDQRLARIFPLT